MHVWNVLHAACWKYNVQKLCKKSQSAHHHSTLSSYIFATKACFGNMLNSNISSRCPDNMVNFGPLAAEIGWRVWGTPANFSGFHVLALLLQWHRSPEANQTLHDVWPSLGLVHYIYPFLGALAPGQNFTRCKIYFASQVLRSPVLAALLHGTQTAGVSRNLLRAARNGITELSQRAPPILAITLGISPHSSFN